MTRFLRDFIFRYSFHKDYGQTKFSAKSSLFQILFFIVWHAQLNAQALTPIGEGLGAAGSILAMEYDSINNLLYVGGSFSYIDGVACNNIAVWNGSTWSALGSGVSSTVQVIKKVGNDVYVGGYFISAGDIAVNGIAKWNGDSWSSIGQGVGTDGPVFAIEYFKNNLYIGGLFSQINHIPANNLARWNIDHWETFGTGANNSVLHLLAIGDTLYASGYFKSINNQSAKYFALFDGVAWQSTGYAEGVDRNYSIIDYNRKLYTVNFRSLEHYDHGIWTTDYKSNWPILNLVSYNHSLYVLTDSSEAKEEVRRFADSSLEAPLYTFDLASSESISVLEGTSSQLFVGGLFSKLNDQRYTSLASFDGNNWIAPARIGIKPLYSNLDAEIRTIFKDTVSRKVYFGGVYEFMNFKYSPGVSVYNEDDSTWDSMGHGFNEMVRKIVEYKGELYAAGTFTASGSTVLNHLAKWNGDDWIPVGTGANDIIYDLTVYNGSLYAAGLFSEIDGAEISYLAKYDGTNWTNAGYSVDGGPVYCMAVYGGNLYAGSLYGQGGGLYELAINNQWKFVFDGAINALLATDNGLYCVVDDGTNFLVKEYWTFWQNLNFPTTEDFGIARLLYMNNTLYCMTSLGGLWRFGNDGWKFISYIDPEAAAQKTNDSYYIGGYFPFNLYNATDFEELNNVAQLTFAPPQFSITASVDSACVRQSIFFHPHSFELNPRYRWKINGGFPDTTSATIPVVQYSAPGEYPVSCTIINDEGSQTVSLSNPVRIDSCGSLAGNGYDNVWTMGYGYGPGIPLPGLNFSYNRPDSTGINTQSGFAQTDACISDVSGNLMFFTNGVSVNDAYGFTISGSEQFNHEGFINDASFWLNAPQTVIILPSVTTANEYYLFHINGSYFNTYSVQPFSLDYSVVQMNDLTRKGTMTEVNRHIINDTLMYGTLQAVKHADGHDWWVVIHKWNSNVFYSMRYSALGMTNISRQAIGPFYHYGFYYGESCFSPDGSMYAITNIDSNEVDLFSFDRCSGQFGFIKSIPIGHKELFLLGCSFSPNNRFLYINNQEYLYQYDLLDSSLKIIDYYDGYVDSAPTRFSTQQLAPDGKIYLSTWDGCKHLHVINSPDENGSACNFVQHQLELTSYNNQSIPIFPNYRLGMLSEDCDTLNTGIGNVNDNNDMKLFPNPAADHVYLSYKLPIDENATVKIFNAVGSVLLSENIRYTLSGLYEFNTSSFLPGIYFVTVYCDHKSLSKTFIVNQ